MLNEHLELIFILRDSPGMDKLTNYFLKFCSGKIYASLKAQNEYISNNKMAIKKKSLFFTRDSAMGKPIFKN